MRLRSTTRREKGFTLIEILIVIAIIAILAAILIGNFLRTQAQAKVAASKGNIRNIAIALETYFSDMNVYPDTLAALVPAYTRAVPDEPCTRDSYDNPAPAIYTPLGGNTDYKISVAFPLTNPCRIISPGISYTPGGGISDSP